MIKNKVLQLRGRNSSKGIFEDISFRMCSEFHWGYQELMEQPIPFVLFLISKMAKQQKDQKNKKLRG